MLDILELRSNIKEAFPYNEDYSKFMECKGILDMREFEYMLEVINGAILITIHEEMGWWSYEISKCAGFKYRKENLDLFAVNLDESQELFDEYRNNILIFNPKNKSC